MGVRFACVFAATRHFDPRFSFPTEPATRETRVFFTDRFPAADSNSSIAGALTDCSSLTPSLSLKAETRVCGMLCSVFFFSVRPTLTRKCWHQKHQVCAAFQNSGILPLLFLNAMFRGNPEMLTRGIAYVRCAKGLPQSRSCRLPCRILPCGPRGSTNCVRPVHTLRLCCEIKQCFLLVLSCFGAWC